MIVIFGAPGAGKSLQGQMLAEQFGWHWISAGQLLRDSGDQEITDTMKSGQMVATKKTIKIISAKLDSIGDLSKIILDGFPRQLEQAQWLVAKKIDLVLVIDISQEESINRLSKRGRLDDTLEAVKERWVSYGQETGQLLEFLESKKIKIVNVDGHGTVEAVHLRIVEVLKSCGLIS